MGQYGIPAPKTRSAVDKRVRAFVKERQWQKVRQSVLVRDDRRCRVCRTRIHVDAHHIKFRSAGGEDSTNNVAAICRVCHDDIHGYRLSLEGNADGKLRITRVKV